MNLFDTCIITASNQQQATVFEKLLAKRIEHGLYPREIEFRVYSDPEAGRIGSGGGTIWALHQYLKDCGAADINAFLRGKRILMIHAGGESRRFPLYVPEGKIFTPVPVPTSSIYPPTVLDMQLTLFLKYPWHNQGEIVVSSGDVVIDFDCTQIPDHRGDICGFTRPVSFEQGSRHGVFQFDRNKQHVTDYFQKESRDFLAEHAKLEGSNECALDMGIISFSPRLLSALLEYASKAKSGESGLIDGFRDGNMSLDLYMEVITACLKGISFGTYLGRVTDRSNLTEEQLSGLFQVLNPFHLSGVLTKKTTFLHFGTLHELIDSGLEMHRKEMLPFYASEQDEVRPDVRDHTIVLNSLDTKTDAENPTYFEGCREVAILGNEGNNLFSGLDEFNLDPDIPENICLDQRRINDRLYTLIYGVYDTFRPQATVKDITFCDASLEEWLEARQLTPRDIWPEQDGYDLLEAKLFWQGMTQSDITGFIRKSSVSEDWLEKFRRSDRMSIREINEADNALERERERLEVRKLILREQFDNGIGWRNISRPDFTETFNGYPEAKLADFYNSTEDNLLREYRYLLLKSLNPEFVDSGESSGFEIDYVSVPGEGRHLKKAIKDDQIVWARSPIRLDLAGGWSDTPPYTLREGGQVTNLAVNLNGQPPIQVFCRPTDDHQVKIHSIDLGETETIRDFRNLEDYQSPTSPFALPKAAMVLLGMERKNFGGQSLKEAMKNIGCGLELTLLCAVPKGSGLGTSSILGATILTALHRFFGLQHTKDELYREVLQMEQMLTTGGGWQDQIGGVAGGAKYIESKPGLKPEPIVHQLDPYLFLHRDFAACYTLFYTGVTRLAKNILQEVVEHSNANTPAYLFTLHYMRQLAVNARRVIALRDLDGLATVVNESWESNKRIHPSTTNEEVESILEGTRGYYTGMKLLGAGGGGYALFLSRDWEQAEQLRDVLSRDYESNRARIVDFSLNQEGLQVSVS